MALGAWSRLAHHPRRYAWMTRAAARALARMGGARKLIHNLPFSRGWTGGRDLPAPAGRTFREVFAQQVTRRARNDQSR
jgi:L-lactate utilization protein LutB